MASADAEADSPRGGTRRGPDRGLRAEIALSRGDALAARGQWAAALDAYRDAANLDDDLTAAHVGIAHAAMALDRHGEAVDSARMAVELDPERADRWILLGQACSEAGWIACARHAYLEALRLEPSAAAVQGCRETACDDFAHPYSFSAIAKNADELHPAERSGLAVAAGIGSQFGGFGAHLAWYFVPPERDFALVPYAGGGLVAAGYGHAVWGPSVGLMAMYGALDRWILDITFGAIGVETLTLWGEVIDVRPLYAITPSIGHESVYSSGIFLRAWLGVPIWIDAARGPLESTLPLPGIGVGYKP